jgi:hypothetical protein
LSATVYRTKEEFEDNCLCAYAIIDYVETHYNTAYIKWFFDRCYDHSTDWDKKEIYTVIFTSFDTPDYKDYVLSIQAVKTDNGYEFNLIKKVDNLSNDSEQE